MRVWHEDLIPKLCRQHLLGCWREALACYSVIANGKEGFRNHPQVREFEGRPSALRQRLRLLRLEMLERGYNPKRLSFDESLNGFREGTYVPVVESRCRPWQSLDKQIEILKKKGCSCRV